MFVPFKDTFLMVGGTADIILHARKAKKSTATPPRETWTR